METNKDKIDQADTQQHMTTCLYAQELEEVQAEWRKLTVTATVTLTVHLFNLQLVKEKINETMSKLLTKATYKMRSKSSISVC